MEYNKNTKKNRLRAQELQENYRIWKITSMQESGYFLIFKGFSDNDILKKISGNALKLFVYLGINSNNFEGVVWHSNKKIAKYFNKSERTIRGWMKELEDNRLIKRMRLKYDGIMYTHLLPYNTNQNDKYTEIIEGNLININNKLYINSMEELIPISSGEYSVEILDTITQTWIFGRIYAYSNHKNYRMNYKMNYNQYGDDDISYVFKSYNQEYIKELNLDTNIKVKIKI